MISGCHTPYLHNLVEDVLILLWVFFCKFFEERFGGLLIKHTTVTAHIFRYTLVDQMSAECRLHISGLDP